MNKKLVSIILLIIISFSIPVNSFAEGQLNIDAKSAILVDYYTGEVIYEQNSDEALPPASITKIMTLLLGMEALESGKISLSDEVRISARAASMGGSQLWLEEGEMQTVENLFKAITIRSANDASVALAEHIAGSEEVFVKMMNEKAKELGMTNTNFMNASGLPHEKHYTSAYDVALMSIELLKHKNIHELLTTYMDEMLVGKKKDKVQSLVNTNRLIKEYNGTTGIKTGSTNEAGFCLSASAKRDNLQLISVVLGSETSKIRFEESMKLLDYGFANYDSIAIGRKGDVIDRVLVYKGDAQYTEAVLERDSFLLLPKGSTGNVTKEIVLPDFIESPIEEGEEIGQLIIKVDGKEMDRVKLVSIKRVGKATLKEMFKKTLKNFLIN
ncbi:D-alanyl-D-alanine carboxypeptidase [Schnuerera sp. xch1]|uniref:D-alanyl-D-alanine carboxypeptidase family protein n=1 Tax=Schnuerera sp. xch1 TaxID=2874283 RepID=UPI001CC0AA8E|nr:D-alanyl-D-alanine carboxypeptidase family protein [Schnuerera sp. xch1]MBZ2173773.1 D-alanyl-D-alanine carboxypeptidase [Schnuerera sp. xch1]